MTVDTASRFQVVESLVRNPGESMITKSTTGPFIDAGLDFGLGDRPFFRGRVYLSKDEVREMADQLGLLDDARLELQTDLTTIVETTDSRIDDAFEAGYAAGRAENLDHLADELVDRMRDRVRRPAADVAVDAGPVGDDSAAAPADAPAEPAPVVKDTDGVLVPAAGSKPKPGPRA